MSYELRSHQAETQRRIDDAWERGVRRMLVSKPTGSGKMVDIAELIRRRPGRAVVLQQSEELIWQTVETIRHHNPSADIGIVKGARDEPHRRIVVASVQTLARAGRLSPLLPLGGTDTLVIDEAHHVAAPTYKRIIEHLGAFNVDGPLTLGVTATPVRGDGVGLSAIFQETVHEVGLLEMIEQDYLSDLRGLQVRLARDYRSLRTVHGDYVDAETGRALSVASAPSKVVAAWQINAVDRPTLIFTPTVALATEMCDAFSAKSISAAALSGKTSAAERRAVLEQFRKGTIRVITNAALLTEGVDLPMVACIVIAKPTKSPVAYAQMVGRGLRPCPGKDDCLVIDVVGSTLDLELHTLATLTGLPLEALNHRGATVRQIKRARVDEGTPRVEPDGYLVTRPVDLLGAERPWITMPNGCYLVAAGSSGCIALIPTGDTWCVRRIRDDRQEILVDKMSFAWARRVAEEHVRKSEATEIHARSAPWRTREPSERQLDYFKALGISMRSVRGRNQGEVSDLIAAAVATRDVGKAA